MSDVVRAITIVPERPDSLELREMARPEPAADAVLVATRAIGVCGTDREIIRGDYGVAPQGSDYLVLGHESAGQVLAAPESSGFAPGDWVVGIVRHPDPVPCANCAAGEWDMCSNGRYTEHGIKGRHGFAVEQYACTPGFLVRGDAGLAESNVLVEPASVVAKAWEHIEYIGRRAVWQPRRVLVTGAGPIGLLAALFAKQRGYEVHVIDRVADGPKPELVRALGARYHDGGVQESVESVDVVLECTGAPSLFFDVLEVVGANGIVCLTGVSSGGHRVPVDAGSLNRELVLENNVVFGSVNANRRHYEAAVATLARANPEWLARLMTRRVRLEDWRAAYAREENDVKTIIVF